jgi:hypothetical protein
LTVNRTTPTFRFDTRTSQINNKKTRYNPLTEMNPSRKQVSFLDRLGRLLDASLIRILVAVLLGYIVVIAVCTSFLGKTFAAWVATPLLAICFFFITKWDKTRVRKEFHWRDVLRPPNLNYWNILWIVISILSLQFAVGVLATGIDNQPCTSDDVAGCIAAHLEDTKSLIMMWMGGAISYFGGGYVAGKLPNFKCPSPYRHAIFGSLLYASISAVFMLPIVLSVTGGELEDEFGFTIVSSLPLFSFALVGVWVTKIKRGRHVAPTPQSNPRSKHFHSRNSDVYSMSHQRRSTMPTGRKPQAHKRGKRKP